METHDFVADTQQLNEDQLSLKDNDHLHTWVVFSTVLGDGWIMLQCVDCGLHATVEDPTSEEWGQAFNAPSRPYQWLDETRVVIHPEIPEWKRYVTRKNSKPFTWLTKRRWGWCRRKVDRIL